MKMNLLLLLSLVSITCSISAMEQGDCVGEDEVFCTKPSKKTNYSQIKTNASKVSERTKALKEKVEEEQELKVSQKTIDLQKELENCLEKHSENECEDIKYKYLDSLFDDSPEMQNCRNWFPDTSNLVDNLCAYDLPLWLKVLIKKEQLKLCLQTVKNENKKKN